jgi:VWFA-related protein
MALACERGPRALWTAALCPIMNGTNQFKMPPFEQWQCTVRAKPRKPGRDYQRPAGQRPAGAVFRALLMAGIAAAIGGAQQPPAKPAAEMSTREEPAVFQAKVNLVMVPVVIRDKQGHAIGDLKQSDFQLFDKGKPQVITRFTMEQPAHPSKKEDPGAKPASPNPAWADQPERFFAYLFDDVHLQFGDLAHVRDSADRHIAGMLPGDRSAIFTTSGQTELEFTDDRDKLHRTLSLLRPRPVTGSGMTECPQMTFYMADLIQNKHDPMVLQAATLDALACMHLDPTQMATAQQMAQAAAQRELNLGDHETRLSLSVLKGAVRRLAGMPGQRTIILVSPGFLTLLDHVSEKADIMDRAIRASVIISTLDARGLYTALPDISRQGPNNPLSANLMMTIERQSATAQADVLAEMASGTGGTFFQNSNDLEEGFRRTAAAPEYIYVLGFSPQNLKMDGSFHALKVTLKNPNSQTLNALGVNARRGYYAPTHMADAKETARREIEEALFSREEMRDIAVDLHSQFFKINDQQAKVSLLIRVDMQRLHFHKENDRNRNDLTVVAGLFDRNGNYQGGVTKQIEMRLKDESLEKLAAGLNIRTTLDAKPGRYAIRLVVRDSEGQMMAAQNGAVEIPY